MKECLACGNAFEGISWACPRCHVEPVAMHGRLAFAPDLAEHDEGFEPHYFDQLFELESDNFWFRSRNGLILWALRTYFASFTSFLEIGCGTGFVLSTIERSFPHTRLLGSEIFSNGLAFTAKRVHNAELFQMDARKIPFVDELDVIGAFDVLEHIKDDEAVLCQMHKSLRTGGGLILTVPQHDFLWSPLDDVSRHVRRYSSRDLRLKAERNGFEVIRITSFVSILLPLMLLSRMMLNAEQVSRDPARELRIAHWKNSVLEWMLGLERGLIRLGLDLPFGGSLLMIAKKGN